MKQLQALCRAHWCTPSWINVEKIKKDKITPAECTGMDGPYNRIRWVKSKR